MGSVLGGMKGTIVNCFGCDNYKAVFLKVLNSERFMLNYLQVK